VPLHRARLCDARNADQKLISLTKQVILSDNCHGFAPQSLDAEPQTPRRALNAEIVDTGRGCVFAVAARVIGLGRSPAVFWRRTTWTRAGSCPSLYDLCLRALATKPKKLAAQRLHCKFAIILLVLIGRIRFQFEQLERSFPEIEQLFRTLWISAPRGRGVLALYHAQPVGRRIADVKFLLDVHRCHILCWARCIAKPRLGWSIAKTGGETGSFATSSTLRFLSRDVFSTLWAGGPAQSGKRREDWAGRASS
jgi:hypothetical protein